MKADCRTFRDALSERLAPQAGAAGSDLTDLSWSEHLLGCEACRDLLEAEEALELLLASLPEPQLPPALIRRVLLRLQSVGDPLDQLLEQGSGPAIPVGLTSRVLRGVRERSGAVDPLDTLLDRLPEPQIPAGLSARVLAGATADIRTQTQVPSAPGLLRRTPGVPQTQGLRRTQRLRRLVAAGVLVVGGAFAWRVLTNGPAGTFDQELLAHLDTLENWDRIDKLSPLEREALALDAAEELIIELGESTR